MRAFFAIDLPEELKNKITAIIKLLQQKNPSKYISWTSPKNLHITLKFLGDVSNTQCEKFLPEIMDVVSQQPKFTLRLEKIDLFPAKRKSRVISWLPSPMGRLVALAHQIEQQVVLYDVPAETRPFKPHLTLARIKKPIKDELQIIDVPQLAFELEKLTLFRSETTHAGSQYEVVSELPLKA